VGSITSRSEIGRPGRNRTDTEWGEELRGEGLFLMENWARGLMMPFSS